MAVDVSHLGITDEQARDLIKLGAAVCAADSFMFNPMWWALEFFENSEDLVHLGARVWEQIDAQHGTV